MCGICGIYTDKDSIKENIVAMNSLLRHRGPDDEGYLAVNDATGEYKNLSGGDSVEKIKKLLPRISKPDFNNYNLFLGHRRLSIIDLSENGHCPMSDNSGKIWITYNGEIYNYIEIRAELEEFGYKFKSNCDTEIIIYSYLHWGENCLNKFNGMWAFAIWDGRSNKLFLSRDRFGVKPLYYYHKNSVFAFCSEIKPLILAMNEKAEIREEKLPFFVLYGNRLNSEDTYLKNIKSLQHSHYLIFSGGKITVKKYYEIPEKTLCTNEEELKENLTGLFSDSIKLRFRSDVKVGTCLSGGLDSSSIVAFSNLIDQKGIETFSAVWSDPACDETRYIDLVNERFGSHPNKIEPKESDFAEVFKRIHYSQEIPTEGPGLYPQWHVMKKAAGKVKVLLDGQGGDEVFGGYYQLGVYLRSLIRDKKASDIFKDAFSYISFLNSNGIHSFSSWLFPGFYNKFIRANLSEQFKIFNPSLISDIPKKQLFYDIEPPKKYNYYLNNLSYHFINNLTIPSLLHYEDRSSMAFSIESRVPFLDYRLVEFGINLAPRHLVDKNITRPLYRKAIEPYLPGEIANRRDKLGYPVPFTKWTRNTLKSYISGILYSQNALIYDYLDFNRVKNNLMRHFKEEIDYGWEIWRLLSLEEILNIYKSLR